MNTSQNKAAIVLREKTEQAYARGLTISQVMKVMFVDYEYAYNVKHGMDTDRNKRRRRDRLSLSDESES